MMDAVEHLLLGRDFSYINEEEYQARRMKKRVGKLFSGGVVLKGEKV